MQTYIMYMNFISGVQIIFIGGMVFMQNSGEKIKAFFNDEEKVKKLADNRKLMDQISGGNATEETYKKELGDLGLTLTDAECREVKKSVDEFMKPQTIDEDILSKISGGIKIPKLGTPLIVLGGTHLGLNAAAAACGIASLVYSSKANKALKNGDLEKSAKYSQTSQKFGFGAGGCLIAGTSLLPLTVAVAGAGINKATDKAQKVVDQLEEQ